MKPDLKKSGDLSRPFRPLGLRIHPYVFLGSAGIILVLVLVAAFQGEALGRVAKQLQAEISEKAGWLYVLAVNVFLGLGLYLIFSPYGRIKLGGPDSKPEFSRLSWFAMLFSAGMGIGLLFYSVAEPIYHYTTPPMGEGGTVEAARLSMSMTFLHWGLHAWGIYAIVGLALAYFGFRHKLPLTIRSAFYPLLGDRINGGIGNLIDILAVVATMFGVATSLGLGVQQIHSGLNFLFDVPRSLEPWFLGLNQTQAIQILLITIITSIATLSVVLGLDKGIRRLSEFNISMAGLLLLFVLLLGPTWFILDSLVQNIGGYLQQLPRLAFWTESYKGVAQGTHWQDGWTTFYWGWWIAWSPFVGMFIARISRGRTVREFMISVLLAPTLVTFIWLSVFGGTALHGELGGDKTISTAVQSDLTTSLFVLLAQFPFSALTSFLAILVVVTFFVTSSDSGSLVIDIITSGGDPDPPVPQRIFWAVMEGLVAAVLLVMGGLQALQTASITTGLPFTIVLLIMCYSLMKGLREDPQMA
jgi:choline/glycine/proline betaine transport protein